MATQRGNKWQANAILNGKRNRPTFNTKEEAEAYERNPSASTEVRPLVRPMFEHGWRYLWQGKKNGHEAYLIVEELIRRLGEDRLVVTITSARIQDLVLELRVDGNSGARINRKLSGLRMLLRHCYEREAITQLPTFPKPQPENHGRERFLTQTEVENLFSEFSQEQHYHFARFLLHTGARVGEALALRWEDMGERSVTFRWSTTKTKQTRTVGLNVPAKEALNYTLGRAWKSPWGGIKYYSFRADWHSAADMVDLGDDPEVVPHILRHTFASWLVQKGVPILTVSKLLGHSSITMTMRYAKLAPDNLLNVTEVLE